MKSRAHLGGRIVAGALGVVAALWLASAVTVVVWGRLDRAQPAEAIVVLGAAQYVGRPSPVLRARLDHAISLFRQGLAPRLILTGGQGEGDTTSEAAVSRKYALRKGVPDTAIMLEREGRTTSESLRAVAALMHAHRLDKAILVSDPFHMFRLYILARRFGLTAYTSPTPTSPISANPSEQWKYVFSESMKAPLAFMLERTEP
jgi:uncharacterized SAM-binding protein YcdF (DUF218 family)